MNFTNKGHKYNSFDSTMGIAQQLMDYIGTAHVNPLTPSGILTPVDTLGLKERIYTRTRSDMERIENEIDHQLTSGVPLISVVGRYIMGSGGKRLRPLLMILSARLCGYQGTQDAPLSIVFEFVHAASLLHDDVVDHAEIRRNRASANTIWGNPAVVLVGDFLYSKSILLAVGYNDIRILEVLSNATTRMAEGEVLQLTHAENLEIGEHEYLEVIARKTAALISASCQIGAIFAGGSAAQEQALRTYGYSLGIAFQLIDDTLDYTGDTEELGKAVGNDIREGKVTLPLVHTLRAGKSKDKKRLQEIFSADEISAQDFMEVKSLVTHYGGIEYTRHMAMQHVEKAKEALQIFPSHASKETLTDIADFVLCRRI